MNENKKIITVIVAFAAIVALVVGISVSEGKKAEKKLQIYLNMVDKKETQVLFLGRPTCSYCVQFQPVIDALKEDYDFDYQYINTDELSSSGLSAVLNKLGIDAEEFGTPYLSITKNGEVLAEQSGYVEREDLFNFLQENGVISKDAVYKSEYPNLTMIDYAQYKEILDGGEKSIVVIGQTGCGYCTKTKPVIDELVEKYDITINYLNLTDLSEDDSSSLMASTTYLKELESIGTPLTLVIENGEVVGHLEGYNESSVFEKFFREQGFIK